MAVENHNGVSWHWKTKSCSQFICLELSPDAIFTTAYKIVDLFDHEISNRCFSTSDAFLYSLFREKFAPTLLNEEQAFSLAINATIASQYLKPLAAKSWLFQPSLNNPAYTVKQGDWVTLNAKEQATYLVLHSGEDTSDVILVSKQHQISDSRVIAQGQTLKVHNDRLSPTLLDLQADNL